MLDRQEIAAASQTLMAHWRAGTKLGALEPSQRPRRRLCDPGRDRTEFGGCIVRLEDRRHQRSRTKAHQCRWPDGGAHPVRNRDSRWRHGLDGGKRNARRRTRICLSHGAGPAAAIRALYGTGSSRCGRRAASGDRDSGFPIFRFRQCWCCTDHRRQRLRASVRAGAADNSELARARARRTQTGHRTARQAIYRARQKRAWRSPDSAGLACQ